MCNSLELGLLPTRVIEVMSAESDRVFLTETTNGQRGKYVALSYCWGQIQASKVFRLTPNNYYACKYNGIIISELPETIQDAIAIARGLAVPYLWVDSLCIIQEDAEDWPRESSTMGDTYSNAFLTIGADCAESATSKIIRNRQWSNLRYCQQFRLGPDCVHVQLKRSPGSDPDHIPAARAHFSKDAAPIHHRAWTFQEYLLSPRMLHYGPNEMTWECNEAWSCECGRVDENLASSSEYVHMSPMLHAVRTGRWNENCDLNSSYDLWDQCLENYTSRALTRETDKLPALSGFVKRVQDLTRHIHGEHDEYLAGLWRGNLPDGLLWEATTPASNRSKATMSGRRPRSYLAPSWSWASLNSPIRKSRTPDFKSKVDIRFVSTRPTTMDPTGQVSAGTLVLQGPLVRQMTLEQPVMQSDRWRLRRVGCPVVEFRPDDPSSLVHGRNTYAFLLIGHNEQLGLSYALILEQSRRDAYVFQRVGLCTQNQSLSTQMQRIRSEALQQLLAASEKEVVTIE
ncbi:hypothetical protein H2203_000426 [Taxawa tesnikishii (nom. ined.)]|nr:hypothetical protein H2203_000426 [Dothideales sp. JES 119]